MRSFGVTNQLGIEGLSGIQSSSTEYAKMSNNPGIPNLNSLLL
jgi:hypothetical protein